MAYYKLSVKQLVATAIGASIFFLLTRFLSYQIFSHVYIMFQYAVLSFFAVVFGPICGLLIGLFGQILADLSFSRDILWSWVVTGASIGLLSGYIFKPNKVENGDLNEMDIVRFIVCSMIVCLVSWGVVKPLGDIFFDSQSASLAFIQSLITGAGIFILIAVFGTILIIGYSKTRKKPTNPD